MRTTAMFSLMALSLLFTPALSAQDSKAAEEDAKEEGSEKTDGIQWTEDYAEAMKTAAAEKKRLFIEFTATW